ncbi:MAG: DUF6206 family protein [Acidimicrobiales bacterium]
MQADTAVHTAAVRCLPRHGRRVRRSTPSSGSGRRRHIGPIDRARQSRHAYLVQPMLDPSTLGERVLGGATPDPDHPYLRALAEVLSIVTPHLSVDAQVTNFSFDGERLTLVDVGTPFLWDDTGSLQFDLGPFLRMLSAPLRPIVAREMHKTVQRWREPRTVAVDIVANLYREQMPEWVEPTIDAMNRRWQWEAPIEAGEAQAIYDEDRKLWPLLKRLQAVERGWQHKVRRRPYDFFIHSTFADREHRPSA